MKKITKKLKLHRLIAWFLAIAMLSGYVPQGVNFKGMNVFKNMGKVQAATTLQNPRIVKDSSMDAGQRVTWDCVWFGSYPQSEVTEKDGDIYNTLKNATGWDSNNDITIGNTKYRRLKGEDATYSSPVNNGHYYDWKNNYSVYHYFKYEPIKWRVLETKDEQAFLFADISLDNQKYNMNETTQMASWENSSIRNWLNGRFISTAFSTTENNMIKPTSMVKNNNIIYKTSREKYIQDKIFLLSKEEMCDTDEAQKYGFIGSADNNDEARRSYCSTYSYAMGTGRNINSNYKGNVWWWLRSPVEDCDKVVAVRYNGKVEIQGLDAYFNCEGIRPALYLNLSATNLYTYAGTVCSDGTVDEILPTEPDDPNKPTTPETVTGDKTEESKKEIKLNGGVDITVPSDIPILGGGKISFDYGNFPIGFWRENNTWRIGIGVKDVNKLIKQKGWTRFKQFVNTQKESYSNGIKTHLVSTLKTASMGMEKKPKISVYGYAEGTITKAGKAQSVGGKLFIEIKGSAEQEWQTIVVVVPVVIKVRGEAGVKADCSLGFDFQNSSMYTKGKLEMTLPGIRVSSGVGVAYVADVSVYGKVENIITVESEKNRTNVTASLNGALGVSAKALCFSYEKDIINGSLTYFSQKGKSKGYSGQIAEIKPEKNDYKIRRVQSSSWNGNVSQLKNTRTFLKNASLVNGNSEMIQTLQSNVYDNAKPQLLQTESGKKILIYTTDVKGRTTGNHTAAVYSVYDEQKGEWSTPEVIEDDGSADFDAVAAVDGENIYVAWVNAKYIFSESEAEADDFMENLAASTEIHMAKIIVDENKQTVTTYSAVTDNMVADLNPSITVENHVPYLAWNSNSANDILKGTGTNSIYLASIIGNTFMIKKLSVEQKPVQSVAVGVLENNVEVAYAVNSSVQGNAQVELVIADANRRKIMAEKGQNISPLFTMIDKKDVLLWYSQKTGTASLNYIDSVSGNVYNYIEGDATISADYTVIDGQESQLLVCTSDKENTEEAGKNLSAYVIKNGKINEPVTLTDLDGYAATPTGIWNGSSYECLFTSVTALITTGRIREITDLCVTSITPKSSLEIGDIDYAQEELMPDKDVTIAIPVKNDGLSACENGSVRIVRNGNIIGQADISDSIASGDTKEVKVSFTVPNNIAMKETLRVDAISNKNNTIDSSKVIKTGGKELSLSVVQEDKAIIATAENVSAFSTEATLTLKAGDADGTILKTINLGSIKAYDKVSKTFTKEELRTFGNDTIYMEISSDVEESVNVDNAVFVYVGQEELKTLDYLIATKKKVNYRNGEILNLDDLEITAVYTDGSKKTVKDYTTNARTIDMKKSGKKQLEILYEEVGIGRKVVMPIVVEGIPESSINNKENDNNRKITISTIRILGLSKQIAAGKKLKLTATILPNNAINKKLLWKSSNTKVATVTQTGVVTLKKKSGGKKAVITATATDGSGVKASWKVTSMKGIVKKVKLTGKKQVKAGKSVKLKAKVKATKKANKKLLWTSSNTKYATVDAKGVVKTKKAGKRKKVKITAMATDGSGKKATITMKIK